MISDCEKKKAEYEREWRAEEWETVLVGHISSVTSFVDCEG